MKKTIKTLLKIATFLAVFAALSPAHAQEKPVSAGLFTPVQVVKEPESVGAFRFSLFYGSNQDLTGFDWTLIGLARLKGNLTGVQLSTVGWVEGPEIKGAQLTLVNIAHHAAVTGLQWGVFNRAKSVTGLQLGIVNWADQLNKGLQIGLVNIAKNGFLPVFVITNFNFN
jgi:hypothetical protein